MVNGLCEKLSQASCGRIGIRKRLKIGDKLLPTGVGICRILQVLLAEHLLTGLDLFRDGKPRRRSKFPGASGAAENTAAGAPGCRPGWGRSCRRPEKSCKASVRTAALRQNPTSGSAFDRNPGGQWTFAAGEPADVLRNWTGKFALAAHRSPKLAVCPSAFDWFTCGFIGCIMSVFMQEYDLSRPG